MYLKQVVAILCQITVALSPPVLYFMCFVWWSADGYGPLWLFGTSEYRRQSQEILERKVPYGTKQTVRLDGILTEVRARDINQMVEEEQDLLPYPPPAECEWQYIVQTFGLFKRAQICHRIASEWAQLLHVSTTDFQAEPAVVALWILGRRHSAGLSCHLRQTARQVQYVRNLIRSAAGKAQTIESQSYYRDAGQRMEEKLISSALVVWDREEIDQNRKHICCKCAINMKAKCKRCPMCSYRYCSVACQKADWKVHKEICSGRRVVQDCATSNQLSDMQQSNTLLETGLNFQSDEDSDTD